MKKTLALSTLILGFSTAVGAQPSPSPSAAAGTGRASLELLVPLERHHMALMAGVARTLAAVGDRQRRGLPVDTALLDGQLATAARTDRDLRVQENILRSRIPGAPPDSQRLAAARRLVVTLITRVRPPQARTSEPQPFSEEALPESTLQDPPTSAGGLRARLRGAPVGSVEGLFGSTAALPRATVPKHSR